MREGLPPPPRAQLACPATRGGRGCLCPNSWAPDSPACLRPLPCPRGAEGAGERAPSPPATDAGSEAERGAPRRHGRWAWDLPRLRLHRLNAPELARGDREADPPAWPADRLCGRGRSRPARSPASCDVGMAVPTRSHAQGPPPCLARHGVPTHCSQRVWDRTGAERGFLREGRVLAAVQRGSRQPGHLAVTCG